ncbi:MAG TPA: twin-arginine translocation signal domain-containing protein [Pseudonocardiaceae bacterium]
MPIDRRKFLGGTAAATVFGATGLPSVNRQRRVRLGLNYTPSRSWWYTWSDWDTASIDADLADIRALGMDHIRIMGLWPELQPNQAFVRGEMVERVHAMLDLAGRHALDVEVTVLDGAISGFLFVPPWLLNNGNGAMTNFYTDPASLAAQRALFTALGKRIGRHPRFLGFDLSNEIYWFTLPFGIDLAPAVGDVWLRDMFVAAESAAPGRLHVAGIDHLPWLNDDYFSRDAIATTGSVTANHTWAGWADVFRTYGPMSTPSLHYSEYFIELIKAFQADPHRQVWIEETGVSKVWMDPALIPQWTEASIRNMASCENLWGITWWSSHEVNPALVGFNPLEYDLGVYTNDRRRKPIGTTIARLAREFDQAPPVALQRSTALVLPDNLVPWTPFFEPYMRLIDRGIRPAVVKASRSTDKAYLESRGIDHLIQLDQAG